MVVCLNVSFDHFETFAAVRQTDVVGTLEDSGGRPSARGVRRQQQLLSKPLRPYRTVPYYVRLVWD